VANISATLVKELRERTGAGMMDCKKVLVESEGDLERGAELLRERGIVKARGKSGRVTSEGRVAASVSDDGRAAALIEINCETDFVAKTSEFQEFCEQLCGLARDGQPDDLDALSSMRLGNGTVDERLTAIIAKLGENVRVRRFGRLQATGNACISSYVHAGGKIGALVHVEAEDPSDSQVVELGHKLCLHVTATNPLGVSREDIPAQEVERERSALRAQAEAEGKPPQIIEKMVEGRLRKFFQEVALLEQPLVMDPDTTVAKAAQAVGAKVVAMKRFQLGEELTK
jgi:elongation factor Ts